MNKKLYPLVLLVSVTITLSACTPKDQNEDQQEKQSIEQTPVVQKVASDLALKNALNLFAQTKASGQDLSNGPCLGIVAPGWVLDIAHNPRQPVDDLPQNQCEEFRNGTAQHFIEMDPEGNIIRAQ